MFFAKQSDFVDKSGGGVGWGLVEADAGDVGGFDVVGVVILFSESSDNIVRLTQMLDRF